MKQETQQIVNHALAALRRKEITPAQFCDATRIPMKDLFLTLYASGETYLILKSDIYTPQFATADAPQKG